MENLYNTMRMLGNGENLMRSLGLCGLLLTSILWSATAATADYASGYEALSVRDYAAAADRFRIESEKGDVFATLALGHLYRVNRGVLIADHAKSAKLTLQAAKAGNCEAQYLIGTFYYRGFGRKQDEKIGLDWFMKSAFCGHSGAQLVVAQSYLNQLSTHDQAVSWLRASARQGHPHALVMLADIYAEGRNTNISHEMAMHLYLRSAKSDYLVAVQRIADALEDGVVAVPLSPLAAKRWRKLEAQLIAQREQERRVSFLVAQDNSISDNTKSINTNNSSKEKIREMASEMATTLLESFPLIANPFSDLPEGLSVAQDDETRKLRPDNQYAIPRRTFTVSKDVQYKVPAPSP